MKLEGKRLQKWLMLQNERRACIQKLSAIDDELQLEDEYVRLKFQIPNNAKFEVGNDGIITVKGDSAQ
jgi:hypothetical protein